MNKIVDGVELLRMAKNNKIKNRTKIKNVNYDKYYEYRDRTFWAETYNIGEEMAFSEILENQFVILFEDRKEDEEIDIQSIEELTKEIKRIKADVNNPHAYGMEIGSYDTIKMGNKINEVVKAIKQLDKKIKE